jgi:hypothetical protein
LIIILVLILQYLDFTAAIIYRKRGEAGREEPPNGKLIYNSTYILLGLT